MSSLLAVLLLMLIPASISMDVAPQDADPFCLTEAASSNMIITDPRQVVLLDTLHYRPQTLVTLFGVTLKWTSLKFIGGDSQERWSDFSQGSGCLHTLLSCYFTNGAQNNWLITQYINISNPSVTDLNVSATYATNVNQGACTGSCTQNVPIHFYWTNTLNETERNDTSNYGDVAARLVHIGNNGERESANLVVPVSQGFNGAYLALVDEGTCVYISRLVVSYTVCPAQNLDLISYPQITAPTINNVDDKIVPVTCVEGASTIEPESLECNIGGMWGSITDSPCLCDPGYQLNGTGLNASCEACPPEHFKTSRSNTEMCRPCPRLSSSPVGNQAVCTCDTGYYRAPSESPSDDCTAPPTAPRNLNTSVLSGILITLTWLPPINTGGRSDLRYDVSYVEGTTTITQSSMVNNITLRSLIPLTNYLISVEAVNGVSEQVGNPAERTVYINVTTPRQPPSEARMVTLIGNTLSWQEPADLYGEALLRFEILAARSDDSSRAEVIHTIEPPTTSFSLEELRPLLPAGQSFVWVRAVSTGGDGVIVTSGIPITGTEMSVGIIIGASAGAIFGIALLLVICLVILIVLVRKQPKQEKYVVEDSAAVPAASNGVLQEMETGLVEDMQNLSTEETKYVDPRNYHSPYDALSALRVDEIPPREIKLSQPLGEGEFGIVYKGKWTRGKETNDVAIKTLRGGANPQDTENFLMEASVMRQFRNHHVVQLYGIVSKVEPIMIIMEFMKNGSLEHYLKSNIDKLDIKRQLKMAHGVASGMAYLSSKEYVHRDLAARNVLVSNDEKCKVADFGLARVMKENVYEVQRGGRIPVRWTAPEAIAYREFTSSSDVWSFGVLLWEIMSYGQTPYDDWNNHEVLERVDRGERLKQPRSCPNDVYIDIMLRCWEADRQDRPTFKDLRKMLDVKIFGRERPEIKPKQPVIEATDNNTEACEDTPIDTWLNSIKMDRYIEVFVKNGYKTVADCTRLTKEHLQEMGITARGHLHKITSNLPSS